MKVEKFALVVTLRPVPRRICYDSNKNTFITIGPLEEGVLVELPESCADELIQDGYARLASVDEVVKYLRGMGVREDTIRWLMQHLEKTDSSS